MSIVALLARISTAPHRPRTTLHKTFSLIATEQGKRGATAGQWRAEIYRKILWGGFFEEMKSTRLKR
jgi:hypothetical protein